MIRFHSLNYSWRDMLRDLFNVWCFTLLYTLFLVTQSPALLQKALVYFVRVFTHEVKR